MDSDKKMIRDFCKKASSYTAWRNPFHVWFVTLFDENKEAFFEIQYSDINMPRREVNWMQKQLSLIDDRMKSAGDEK